MKADSYPISVSGLLVIVLFTLYGHSKAYAQDTLTVMTYNIYHGERGYQPGKSNLEGIAGLINRISPDFIALQEVDSLTGRSASLHKGKPVNLVERLADLTNMYGYFGKAIDFDGGGYGEGILARELLQATKVMLPNPKGGEKRALLMVEGQTKTGRSFMFAGTHLCHQYSENRLAQVRKINRIFSKEALPVILGGDFNFTPRSNSYETMQKHWKDAAVMKGNPKATFSYKKPSQRIDYLFLSGNTRWEVVNLEIIEVDYSDHMPVVATVVFK